MNKLLLELGMFLTPIMLFLAFLEQQCRSVTAFSKNKDHFIKNLNKIEVVAMGTSHIEFGITNKKDQPVFNWGAAGQSFGYENALLNKFLSRMKSLKLVFIEVSETRLLLSEDKDLWYSNVYWIHYGVPYNVDIFNPFAHFHVTHGFEFFRPLVISNWMRHESDAVIDENGGEVAYHKGRFEKLNYDTTAIKSSFNMVYDFKSNEDQMSYHLNMLNQTISLLKSNGIDVVLLHPPFYKTFSSEIPEDWRIYCERAFTELSEYHGIRYLNFNESLRWDVDYFYDDNHLNKKGAEMWTSMVMDSIYPANLLTK